VAGDGRGAWGVVEAALTAGAELDEIYLDIIAPAMRSIGNRWASGELDISVEHRATGIAFRLLGRLGPRFARRGRSRGAVLLGTPVGEHHSLPVAMVGDLLRGVGWEVSDLGADLPVESFVRAALDTPDLVAVGVSVTSPDNLPAAAEVLAAMRAAVSEAVLVVGGAAVAGAAHARELGAQGWAASAREFDELLVQRGSPGSRVG
jgi:methanogenic corrinoid protein MtbC1